jgi:hypothetical protein
VPDIFSLEDSETYEEALAKFEKTFDYYLDKNMALQDLVMQGFKLAEIEAKLRHLKVNSNCDNTTENLKEQSNKLIF